MDSFLNANKLSKISLQMPKISTWASQKKQNDCGFRSLETPSYRTMGMADGGVNAGGGWGDDATFLGLFFWLPSGELT